jgi:hypothetical protein
MSREVFSGAAWVEIQGERVMILVQVTNKFAKYKLTGFKHPIIIRDYRRQNLPLIRRAEAANDATGFANHFNAPAHIQIQRQKPSRLLIQLRDIDEPDPPYRLWIASGIDDQIPVYDFVFERLARLAGDRFAFLALYCRDSGSTSSVS